MSRVRIAVAAGLLAAASAVWLWSIRASDRPAARGRVAIAAAPPQIETPTVATAVQPAATATTDYAARFRDSNDMLAFIDSIRAAANAGDGAAQYYLFRAVHRCTLEYILYFGRDERERTLDQALIVAEKTPGFDQLTARELFEKCRALKQRHPAEMAEESRWLARAADSRYPLALATVAREKSRQLFMQHAADELAGIKSAVRALALEALRSKDPAVIAELAEVAPRFADDPSAADDVNAVWIIAACQRGFSCGNESESFRFLCRLDIACQPYETVTDLLRRAKGAGYDVLEARARELSEKIDQGRVDELGF